MWLVLVGQKSCECASANHSRMTPHQQSHGWIQDLKVPQLSLASRHGHHQWHPPYSSYPARASIGSPHGIPGAMGLVHVEVSFALMVGLHPPIHCSRKCPLWAFV